MTDSSFPLTDSRVRANSAPLVRIGVLLLIFVLGMGLRLLWMAAVAPHVDVLNFADSAGYMARGQNLFAYQPYYNYSPLWAILLVPLTRLSLPFTSSYRLLLSLLSFVTALCVGAIARQQDVTRWYWSIALYYLNPFTVLLDGAIGQFDQVALIPVLLCVLLARRQERALFGLGALAVLLKHIVVFQVWTLFIYRWGTWKGSLRFFGIVAIFILSFAPFVQTGWYYIVWNVFFYSAPWERWGLQYFLTHSLNVVLFYGVMIALPFASKRLRLSLVDALFLSATMLFVFTYGFSYPTLIIPLAWACIRPSRWLIVPLFLMTTRALPGGILPEPAYLIVWVCMGLASLALIRKHAA